jgi:hypothetical protein
VSLCLSPSNPENSQTKQKLLLLLVERNVMHDLGLMRTHNQGLPINCGILVDKKAIKKESSLSSRKRPNATCTRRSRHHHHQQQHHHKRKRNYLKYSAQDSVITFSLPLSQSTPPQFPKTSGSSSSEWSRWVVVARLLRREWAFVPVRKTSLWISLCLSPSLCPSVPLSVCVSIFLS